MPYMRIEYITINRNAYVHFEQNIDLNNKILIQNVKIKIDETNEKICNNIYNQINVKKTLNCDEESCSINTSVEDITPASNTLLLYQFISADLSPALDAVQLGCTTYN